jgi:hypothetical protein
MKYYKQDREEKRGDTSRTSSQGRKFSTGGNVNSKRNSQRAPDTKSVKAEMKIRSRKPDNRG